MPTVKEVFTKHHTDRADGVQVLTRPLISVAALEAGYSLESPTIDDAVTSTKYPGQMTEEEFAEFCEKNKDNFISPQAMAKSVVVVSPSGVITRASLQEITKKSSDSSSGLSDEEVDALFATLDKDNKGAISAEDLMRAMYGEEGALCLAEQRKKDSLAAAKQKEEREGQEAEREQQEKQKKEEADAANAAAAAAAQAKKESDDAEEKKKSDKKDDSDKKSKEGKKEKAKGGCC
ncbi:i/6 autoantigen-like protein [Angomonas deanei]|uniref:EF-hand domain pair, putative n=1 Tax=Angomonas deanei TaxID=59799 RepID=A0A7G2CFB2_9TRYP|nr:i/6 autoantigen-like protein [Angomonas deanei]CAD2218466.1 EF-hand domain pair, putative [Angomonas deanei]|eukprot:EPY39809.1 i/6 autoantigen-like protein [Angomonas deanei]